jgi:hypothetical protein
MDVNRCAGGPGVELMKKRQVEIIPSGRRIEAQATDGRFEVAGFEVVDNRLKGFSVVFCKRL